jgi:hypothetical protein
MLRIALLKAAMEVEDRACGPNIQNLLLYMCIGDRPRFICSTPCLCRFVIQSTSAYYNATQYAK